MSDYSSDVCTTDMRVDDPERCKREREKNERHDAGAGIVESLDPIVDRDRRRLRLAGDAAADHQDHAELAKRMGERKHQAGDDTGPGQRQIDICPPLTPRQARNASRPPDTTEQTA